MSVTTMESLRQGAENRSLIRKPLRMLAFLAPMTAPAVEALTDAATGELLAVPEDYEPVGLIAKESGITFPTESETSTVESANHAAPTREDFESMTRQISYTAQETKRVNLEMAYSIDLGAPLQQANGEVGFAHPTLPDELQRRLLVIAADPKGDWFMGKFFPSVSPMSLSEVSWTSSAAITYATTLTAFIDDTLGYSLWDIPIAGPGAQAAIASGITGFEAVVPGP